MVLSRAKLHKIAMQARRDLFYDGGHYGEAKMESAVRAYLTTGDVQQLSYYLPHLVNEAVELNEKYGDLGLPEPT